MPTLNKTFDKTKAVAARWGRIDFTPTGGAVVKLSGKLLDIDAKLATSVLKQPGADDLNHAVEEVAVEIDESITLVDIEEIDAMLALLGGFNGLVKGSAVVYVRDPRDAAGKVKYLIPAFYCSVKRPDGAIRLGGTDWSKTSLVFTNLSGTKLTPTIAGDAPDV